MSVLFHLGVASFIVFFRTSNIVFSKESGPSYFFYQQPEYPRDCKEVRDSCNTQISSGVFIIKPDGYHNPFEVYCDNDADSGGWTVVMAMGVSNATVESGFSVLTSMMSDRRISLKHARMEDLMLIKANDRIWLETEREAIIDDALDQFMQKKQRRKQRLEPSSPVEKRPRHDVNPDPEEHSSSSSSSSTSGEESEPEEEFEPEPKLSFSGLEESDEPNKPDKRKSDDVKEDSEPAEDEKSDVSEEPDVFSEPDMLDVSSPTKTTSSEDSDSSF